MKPTVFSLAMLALAPFCVSMHAASITIANPSFESPATAPSNNVPASLIDGWTLEGPGSVGVWNIIPGGFYSVGAPVGSQIAFLGGASAGLGTAISQILSDTLEANTIYSLSGFIGHPVGFGPSTGTTFTAQLFAGATLLSTLTTTGPTGSFSPFALNFDSTGSPAIGQPLKVRFSTNQPQVGIDGITLNTVPEPTTGEGVYRGRGQSVHRCKKAMDSPAPER